VALLLFKLPRRRGKVGSMKRGIRSSSFASFKALIAQQAPNVIQPCFFKRNAVQGETMQ
jgi:hypothetical protein